MQKVEGSSPFIRFERPRNGAFLAGQSAQVGGRYVLKRSLKENSGSAADSPDGHRGFPRTHDRSPRMAESPVPEVQ